MSNSDYTQMGEDIRVQGGQGQGPMTELVFNPEKGEFVTVPKGSINPDDSIVVTEMTKEGFA